jgi:drug/metabolite transporter (DMT)-like permease
MRAFRSSARRRGTYGDPMYFVISFALMIGFTVAANVFLKTGSMVPAAERAIMGVWDWRTLLGFTFFGGAAMIYSAVLQWMPLNVAQSIAASQFVAVILASAIILAEPIPLTRMAGILLIVAGIVVVSFSQKPSSASMPAITTSAEDTPH